MDIYNQQFPNRNEVKVLFAHTDPSEVTLIVNELKPLMAKGDSIIHETSTTISSFKEQLVSFDPELIVSISASSGGIDYNDVIEACDALEDPPSIVIYTGLSKDFRYVRDKETKAFIILKNTIHGLSQTIAKRIERKKMADESLRYKFIFECSPFPWYTYDKKTLKFVEVSHAMVDLFGYSEEEFQDLSVLDIIKPEDHKRYFEYLSTYDKVHQNFTDWQFVKKDHTIVHITVDSRNTPFGDNNRRLVLLADVSERVSREAHLMKLNKLLSILGDVNGLIQIVHDKDVLLNGLVTACTKNGYFDLVLFVELDQDNDMLSATYGSGASSDLLVNTSNPFRKYIEKNDPCCQAIYCDKATIVNGLNASMKHVMGNEIFTSAGIKSIAYIPIKVSDTRRNVICLCSKEINFFDDNEIKLLDDLSKSVALGLRSIEANEELRKAVALAAYNEARYKRIFDEDISGDFISLVDGTIIDCNKALYTMFGCKYREQMLQYNMKDFYSDKKVRAAIIENLKTVKSLTIDEVEYVNLKGNRIIATLNIVAIYGENGDVEKLQGYVIDVTQTKMMEHELLKSKEMIEQANMIKDVLLANISHEIRTPLNAIIGFSTIIRETIGDAFETENLSECFDIIAESSDRLIRTVDLIIVISKLKTNSVAVKIVNFNIIKLIDDLLIDMSPLATRKKVELRFKNNTNVSIVKGDVDCCKVILSNILDNALKFTREGYVEIACEQNTPNSISVVIADSGIGMEPEFVEKLFTPFTQAEVSLSRQYEGLGLGLSVSRQFADIMGYNIHVQSKEKEGSTFTIVIPI